MMTDQFAVATSVALVAVAEQMADNAERANQQVVAAQRPTSVARSVDGRAVFAAADVAQVVLRAISMARDNRRTRTRLVYSYGQIADIVSFALAVLHEKSPVGAIGDDHPGLYRDSHLIFLNGRLVNDLSAWRPGDVVHISNDAPYARKIEANGFTLHVPGYVYETTSQIVAGKFGNQADIRFVFMPVRSGNAARYAASAAGRSAASLARGGRVSLHADWLSRQPAIQITAR